jgi:hypothetical protein
LEYQLHRHFLLLQMNKVDHRKEFFHVDLKRIREEVEGLGLAVRWTMAAEAAEYRESLAIERAIAESTVARDAWLKRQLELHPPEDRLTADALAAEEVEASGAAAPGRGLLSAVAEVRGEEAG